jgi:RNA polymerase sigma factor (sigma-70 family)
MNSLAMDKNSSVPFDNAPLGMLEAIHAFQSGDVEAFESVCPQIQHAAYVRACKMGLDPEESEDIAQKVLVRVYLHASKAEFTGKGRLWSWIYTITAREIYKYWGRKRPELVSEEALQALFADRFTDSTEDPAAVYVASEVVEDVGECIGRLEESQRLCLLGPLAGELTFRQAAAIHNLSLGQFKHRYEKAIAKVRDCMKSKGHEIEKK